MIDIKKLAKLTGLALTPAQEEKFSTQLGGVVDMLDQIKHYTIEKPNYTWHSLLGLQSHPSSVHNASPKACINALFSWTRKPPPKNILYIFQIKRNFFMDLTTVTFLCAAHAV